MKYHLISKIAHLSKQINYFYQRCKLAEPSNEIINLANEVYSSLSDFTNESEDSELNSVIANFLKVFERLQENYEEFTTDVELSQDTVGEKVEHYFNVLDLTKKLAEIIANNNFSERLIDNGMEEDGFNQIIITMQSLIKDTQKYKKKIFGDITKEELARSILDREREGFENKLDVREVGGYQYSPDKQKRQEYNKQKWKEFMLDKAYVLSLLEKNPNLSDHVANAKVQLVLQILEQAKNNYANYWQRIKSNPEKHTKWNERLRKAKAKWSKKTSKSNMEQLESLLAGKLSTQSIISEKDSVKQENMLKERQEAESELARLKKLLDPEGARAKTIERGALKTKEKKESGSLEGESLKLLFDFNSFKQKKIKAMIYDYRETLAKKFPELRQALAEKFEAIKLAKEDAEKSLLNNDLKSKKLADSKVREFEKEIKEVIVPNLEKAIKNRKAVENLLESIEEYQRLSVIEEAFRNYVNKVKVSSVEDKKDLFEEGLVVVNNLLKDPLINNLTIMKKLQAFVDALGENNE